MRLGRARPHRKKVHPQEAQECAVSQEVKDALHKADAMHTLMAATRKSLRNTTRKTQAAVAALLLQSMTKQTKRSSSHHRSVLGDKGNTLWTVGKGVRTGCKDVTVDGWTIVRWARVQTTD